MTEKFTSVDEYIDSFPTEQQQILRDIRRTLLEAVPGGRYGLHYAAIVHWPLLLASGLDPEEP